MAYKVIILYRLYMPSYFLGTFTEYPKLIVAHFNFNRGSKQSASLLPRFVIFISSFSESIL